MPARSATVLSALLLLGACKPREPESLSAVADRLDFAMTPRLPAPEAGTYATTQTTARDPVIGELTRWHHYDAGLAGAASGLALAMVEDRGSVSRWELREALWRAGYPYPVFDARGWTVGAQQPPPRDVIAWLEATPRDEPMALMRARGRDSDAWVGMRAHPDIELGSIPRVATLGTALPLPVVAGGTWIASDGTGQVTEGTLDEGAALLLASAGEWMLVLQRGKVELARLPIYVGISPPSEPLLLLPESPPQDVTSEDVTEHARLLLRHVRNTYGMPAWKSSPMFDAAVGRYLQDPSQGARAVLATLGFPGSDAVVWACDAATVENCFDTWMWDPRRRDVLLTPRMDSYGLHASLDARGVHLTLLLLRAGVTMRARRGLLTRWEVAVLVLVAAAVAAYVVPIAQRATWRTRRAEVGMVLDSLQSAEIAWRGGHGSWFTLTATPRGADHVGGDVVGWPAELPGGWQPPIDKARGSYHTEPGEGGGVVIVGTCDVDGDGVRAVYRAVPGGPIVRVTPEDVY